MKILSLERLKNIKLVDLLMTRIVRFKYTAILDDKVCPYCESRDGMVINSTDPEYSLYMPPAHPHCRCHWIPIESDSEIIPERNWTKPDSSFSKYFPFLFIIPFKGKKDKPIDVFPFAPESPNPDFNPEDIFPMGKYDTGRTD